MAYEMMRVVAADTNGDGTMTQDDTWGYITGIGDINGLMVASDRHYIVRDSSGQMQLNYSSSEVIAAAEKMEKMILDPNISVYMNKYAWGWDVFPAGRALFMANSIRAFYNDWRALDLDISLVPSPKFDENQSEYRALMSNCSMGISVPATASDPERTGTIIEAMNAYSYKAIDKVYYEITLQDKLARDEYSSKMLDIIVNARTVDIAVLNENAWGNVVSAFLNSFEAKGSSNLASLEEKYGKASRKFATELSKHMKEMIPEIEMEKRMIHCELLS